MKLKQKFEIFMWSGVSLAGAVLMILAIINAGNWIFAFVGGAALLCGGAITASTIKRENEII